MTPQSLKPGWEMVKFDDTRGTLLCGWLIIEIFGAQLPRRLLCQFSFLTPLKMTH